jgi:transcriptional regulator with XRE-family HTH domain
MDIRRQVGQNVRLFRSRLGISQEELAFRSGLHRTYVSGVERGIRNPTALIIDRLAKALTGTAKSGLGTKPFMAARAAAYGRRLTELLDKYWNGPHGFGGR